MGNKPRREVMCKACMSVFTTKDRRRFSCYKCEPVPGTKTPPKPPPERPVRESNRLRNKGFKPKATFTAGDVFKDQFDKLKGLK